MIEKGPGIQGLSYNMERIIGIAFDGSVMTRDTCGLAVVDDQLTMVTDVILEKGIEAVTEVAGLIQLKETYVRDWVVAYDLYRRKFNKEKPMRAALGDHIRKPGIVGQERSGNRTTTVWFLYRPTFVKKNSKGRKA